MQPRVPLRGRGVGKPTAAIVVLAVLCGCSAPASAGTGHARASGSDDGEYRCPEGTFRVDVPVMRNPFVKEPSVVHEERRSDGGMQVTFAVPELGEAWCFGTRPVPSPADGDVLDRVCDEELGRWLVARDALAVPAAPRAPAAEPEVVLTDDHEAGRARIYYVESAALLSGQQGALVGVLARESGRAGRVLFAVGQYDMPNYSGHFTLETEKGRRNLAAEQLQRLLEQAASLRSP